MSEHNIFDTGGETAVNPGTEDTIVLEHISSGRILVSILVLVVLYVVSKWLVSQQEPNIRIDGKFSKKSLAIMIHKSN